MITFAMLDKFTPSVKSLMEEHLKTSKLVPPGVYMARIEFGYSFSEDGSVKIMAYAIQVDANHDKVKRP